MQNTPNVLTIAGSDCSGGAGIQADIKTLTRLDVYAASVITNVTAQNSVGVQAVHPLPAVLVRQQLESVLSDIKFQAIKIGMLYDAEIINTVADVLKTKSDTNIIIDPILISSTGTPLLKASAKDSLIRNLFPLASLITPNLPETDHLLLALTSDIENLSSQQKAERLNQEFKCDILVKGGHEDSKTLHEYLRANGESFCFTHDKLDTENTHGTGCTLSSAIAAYISKGFNTHDSVERALKFTERCIKQSDALNVGKSYGPVNHLI